MATREENLKKINAELEQLSDEELEKIAGSTGDRGLEFTSPSQIEELILGKMKGSNKNGNT